MLPRTQVSAGWGHPALLPFSKFPQCTFCYRQFLIAHSSFLIPLYRPPRPSVSGRYPASNSHLLTPNFPLSPAPKAAHNKKAPALTAGALKAISQAENYFSILETTPEPTVWPPSRIAKRMPSSMATGVISSTCISTLSPGMHISVPSGRVMMPVTSVVRK